VQDLDGQMTEIQTYRDACRRQHRVIGNYLALEAWSRTLDCIALDRGDLVKLLGLTRFKSTRVAWMQSDLAPWFPYQQAYYLTRAKSSIGSLFLSRLPIEQHLPKGSMSDDERIARMKADAPPTGKLAQGRRKIPDEAAIVARLAVLAAGLDVPTKRK
jgi:hypothetical protein